MTRDLFDSSFFFLSLSCFLHVTCLGTSHCLSYRGCCYKQKDNSNLQNPYDPFSSYSGGFGNVLGNVYHRPNTDWVDLVLQPYPFSAHYTQGMSYIIRNLEPDQQYEAKVIARYVRRSQLVSRGEKTENRKLFSN